MPWALQQVREELAHQLDAVTQELAVLRDEQARHAAELAPVTATRAAAAANAGLESATFVAADAAWQPRNQHVQALARAIAQLEARRAELTAQRTNPYYGLPRIVIVDAIEDAGEYGAARCPHCGAEGRYIYHFRCDDGEAYAAMKGCFNHFPQHPLAAIAAKILDKQRKLQQDNQRRGTTRTLGSWDTDQLNAIEALVAGRISEADALAAVQDAERRKHAWMRQRGLRR